MTTDAHRSRPLRFGLTAGLPRTGEQMRAFARAVETSGFDVLGQAVVETAEPQQAAEQLIHRRQRFGIVYWTVFDELPGRPSAMPDMSEVIKLLR
ncbi:hypothetical protein AU193_13240 [Mycobacterium sp. GA-1285]|uniref:hypothetical protein n=1 Tax=Mycobacterium sp. GA-1285 TaxID=1772282 RepID=UPI000746DCE3|nr:hypothetical protein [Mycobacterium sp. GA-1285]KUI19594.1 hypothetical protein AU193_13240 [Mycobacterium sp. GA-1285]